MPLCHDTYVKEFNLEGKYVKVKRALEDGYEVLKVKLPCVLTAIKELNEPRYMSVPGILKAAKADIKVWNAEDIGVDLKTVGLKASPTNVFKSFTPKPKGGRCDSRRRYAKGEGREPCSCSEREAHHLGGSRR